MKPEGTAPSPPVSNVAPPVRPPDAAARSPADLSEPPAALWARVRSAAAGGSKFVAALIEELSLHRVEGSRVFVVGRREMIQAASVKLADVELLLARAWGTRVTVVLTPIDADQVAGGNVVTGDGVSRAGREAGPREAASDDRPAMQDHPLVRRAIEQLGARLITVQPRTRQEP